MHELDLEQVAGQNSFPPKEHPWLFLLLIAPMAVLPNGIISPHLYPTASERKLRYLHTRYPIEILSSSYSGGPTVTTK